MLSFETKRTIHKRGSFKTNMSTTCGCHWTIMESWEEAKTLTFGRGHNVPTFFFRIYKRGLKRAGSIDLSNQVTNHDTRSGLP